MINSVHNPLIKQSKKYHMKKNRYQAKRCLIEGFHLLEEAEKQGVLESVFLLQANDAYPGAHLVSAHVMKHLTDAKNPPPAAGIAKIKQADITGDKVLFLEHLQDPGNVGTLLRSALAFGFDTVVLDHCADPYGPKVLRSTQGAIFHLNIAQHDFETLKTKRPDLTTVGAALTKNAAKPTPISSPYCLCLGNEGAGLKDSTLATLDQTVMIPIKTIDSLNVSIAGSILMYAMQPTTLK